MTNNQRRPVLEEISRARFDAFVGYARAPEVALVAAEIAWFESESSEVFAVLLIDTDEEFSAALFAADLDGRFRWITQTDFVDDINSAIDELGTLTARVLNDLDNYRNQGDEKGAPTDFFDPRVPTERQHPNFRRVAEWQGHEAARALISVMMRWYEDRDGNFIEQFQSTGFDARVWELYLWATLISLGYEVTMPKPSPDFVARGLDGIFAVEATTINPPVGRDGQPLTIPRPTRPEELQAYAEHYLPIRYAGPLTSKLAKRYWERPGIAGMPLVFAVQDFHDESSMTFSQGGLVSYLFGISVHNTNDQGTSAPITHHVWGAKTVPSGFFTLPGAEHVAAVAFNCQGTISKFTRMAIKSGFDPGGARVVHAGRRLDLDDDEPHPIAFSEIVTVDYPEDWVDGLDVFHNPNALHPLDVDLLPGAAHHTLTSPGNITTLYPDDHIVTSKTVIVAPTAESSDDAAS